MRIFTYKSGDAIDHKRLGDYLRSLPEGSNFVVTVKHNRPIRSISQNRYYFLCLKIIGLSTGHTVEELHEVMKLKFHSDVIHFPKSGSQLIAKTTSDLSSSEFSAYVNRVKQFALDEFQIVIPDPDSFNTQSIMDLHNQYEQSNNG